MYLKRKVMRGDDLLLRSIVHVYRLRIKIHVINYYLKYLHVIVI